jgi:hypothetical protein
MKATPYLPTVCSFAWALVLLLPLSVGWGCQPLCRPNAAVAHINEMEIELGCFNLDETGVSGRKKNPT